MQESQSVSKEEALQALEEVMKELRMRIDREDQELWNFEIRDRVRRKNGTRLTRAFHCFGNKYVASRSLSFKAKRLLRKAKDGHIHVHPESVQRRAANKSKTKQELVSKKPAKLFYLQCNTTCTVKRKHSLSENIEKNEQTGKKQGRTMASRTNQILQKVNKGEPINRSKKSRKVENITATGSLRKRKLTTDNKCDCNRGFNVDFTIYILTTNSIEFDFLEVHLCGKLCVNFRFDVVKDALCTIRLLPKIELLARASNETCLEN